MAAITPKAYVTAKKRSPYRSQTSQRTSQALADQLTSTAPLTNQEIHRVPHLHQAFLLATFATRQKLSGCTKQHKSNHTKPSDLTT